MRETEMEGHVVILIRHELRQQLLGCYTELDITIT